MFITYLISLLIYLNTIYKIIIRFQSKLCKDKTVKAATFSEQLIPSGNLCVHKNNVEVTSICKGFHVSLAIVFLNKSLYQALRQALEAWATYIFSFSCLRRNFLT